MPMVFNYFGVDIIVCYTKLMKNKQPWRKADESLRSLQQAQQEPHEDALGYAQRDYQMHILQQNQ